MGGTEPIQSHTQPCFLINPCPHWELVLFRVLPLATLGGSLGGHNLRGLPDPRAAGRGDIQQDRVLVPGSLVAAGGRVQHHHSASQQPSACPGISSMTLLWGTNIMPGSGDVGVMPADRALPAPFSTPPVACSQRPISRSIDRQINHSEVMIYVGNERHWVWLSWPLSGDIQMAPRR